MIKKKKKKRVNTQHLLFLACSGPVILGINYEEEEKYFWHYYITQTFYPNDFNFFLLIGVIWYLHGMVHGTWFTSFTGYAEDVFHVISYKHI